MKKRLVSLSLILSIIMTSVSVFAYSDVDVPPSEIIDYIYEFDVGDFAQHDTDDNGEVDPDQSRMEFLYRLGLWDDIQKPGTQFLTVKEFVAIMLKAIPKNSDASLYTYDPNDNSNVAYGTVLESLLKSLGYYYKCEQYDDKEQGIIAVATQIGLVKGDAKAFGSFITRAEFAKILEWAIDIDICVIKQTSGGYTPVVSKGETVLTSMHDIYNVSGFVNAVPGFAVYGNGALKEGYMEIDRIPFRTGTIDCTKYIATRVRAFAQFDDASGEYKIISIAFDDVNGKRLEIDFRDIAGISNDEIRYAGANGSTRKISVKNYKSIVENGRLLHSVSEIGDISHKDGKIILSSSTKGGSYDIAVIYKYDYYVVKYCDTYQMRIGLDFGQKYAGNEYIQIDEEAINYVTVDGAVKEYKEIPAGSAIRVFRNDVTGYTNIAAVSIRQFGEVSRISDDGTVTVADRTYRLSQNLINRIDECAVDSSIPSGKKVTMLKPGDNIAFYYFDDMIVGYISQGEYRYAYLKAVGLDETEKLENLQLRVYTQNMDWVNLGFAKRVTIDGHAGYTKKEAAKYIDANGPEIVSNLIRFGTNEEGKVVFLDTIIESPAEAEETDDLTYAPECVGNTSIRFKHSWDNWSLKNTKYMFNRSAPIFVVPLNEDREAKYKVVAPTVFTRDSEYDVILYSPDKFLQPAAIVYKGDVSIAVDQKESWLYITQMNRIVMDDDDADCDLGYEIVGMHCGSTGIVGTGYCKEEKYIMSDDEYEDAVATGKAFEVGDFMRVEYVGKKLRTWVLKRNVLDKGRIIAPEGITDDEIIDSNQFKIAVGTITAVNLLGDPLVKIACGSEGERVYITHSRAIINLTDGKMEEVTLADFHEGDQVIAFVNGNYCSVLLKNVQ